MILDFRDDAAPLGVVIDLDTGKAIPLVCWMDDTDSPAGHSYEQYVTDEQGRLRLNAAHTEVLTRRVTGARIRFMPADSAAASHYSWFSYGW